MTNSKIPRLFSNLDPSQGNILCLNLLLTSPQILLDQLLKNNTPIKNASIIMKQKSCSRQNKMATENHQLASLAVHQ